MKSLNFSRATKENNQDRKFIRLNLNESSLDIPNGLKKKILEKLKKIKWNRYPDESNPELIQALADYCGVKEQNILLGNGSNELIQNIIRAFGDSGKIILFKPSFSIYAQEARIQQRLFLEFPLQPGRGYQAGSWLEKLTSASLIFLDSPNNPLGCTISPKLLQMVLDKTKGVTVIDEAYVEFSDGSFCKWIRQHKNLIVLRTFSKAFRLAGARFGYLVASEEVVDRIRKVQLPFSVGIFQRVAALVAVSQKSLILKYAEKIKSERERLFHQLKDFKNFEPFPSKANFILIRSRKFSGEDVYNFLKQRGILVRIFDLPELSNFFRVTVGTAKENYYFLKALKSLDQETKNVKKS